MRTTRRHVCQIELGASPERVFAILHTPSAIRAWWGAARAIVLAEEGGIWAAAWGEREDDPDYISTASIKRFEPPHRLLLGDFKYFARSGRCHSRLTLPRSSSSSRTQKAPFSAWFKMAFRWTLPPMLFTRRARSAGGIHSTGSNVS